MRQKKEFVLREVCGEPFIMQQGTGSIDFGRLLSLSESAAWLWKQAGQQGYFTVESLTAALCDEYDVSPEQAATDVSRLVAGWLEEGIVEP